MDMQQVNTYRIEDAIRETGLTHDRINYQIRRGIINPQKVGNRYVFTDEQLQGLRRAELRVDYSLELIEAEPLLADRVALERAKRPQTRWSAVVFGGTDLSGPEINVNVIALSVGFSTSPALMRPVGSDFKPVRRVELYTLSKFYQRETPPEGNLACVFIETPYPEYVLDHLAKLPAVQRCGDTGSSRGLFAEVRYATLEDFEVVVINQIQGTREVTRTTELIAAPSHVFDKSAKDLAVPAGAI